MAGLPTTMRALVQTGPGEASLQTVPMPEVEFGTVLIKVDAILVNANLRTFFEAALPHFQLPYPVIMGTNAVGRVVAAGPDATVLSEGKLVITNTFIRARDDPSHHILWGISAGTTPEQNRLYDSMARHGACAEYLRAPLENTFVLDEARLLGEPSTGGLGLKAPELLQLVFDTILYSGLRTMNLQAGERIIVTPATGQFSAAAVDVAVALGADVIAASRNQDKLANLKQVHPGIHTVQLTGSVEADAKALGAFGVVDAVMEVSPPGATGSTNLAAAASVVKQYGRICLMGTRFDENLPIPYMVAVNKSLTIYGQHMFRREHQRGIIKLAESGLLKLGTAGGHNIEAAYGLDELQLALDKATDTSNLGSIVVLKP